MAGKFINTSNQEIFSNIINTTKSILNNPFYMFSDKKGSECTYYNINTTKTTLDEATRANYSELGENSPIRFNKVNNFLLYGVTKIDFSYDVSDIGLEADPITGEAVILPNTIVPYPGDYFLLTQISKPYLFKVTSVNQNLLDDESIMYKINYTLMYTKTTPIDTQVVKEFKTIAGNIGTNFACIIESDEYSLIESIEAYTQKLKEYFYMIFYDVKIQSFSYRLTDNSKVYDPYLIEFLKRNKILKGLDKYVNVSQQMYLDNLFGVIYDRTIFSALETKKYKPKKTVHTGVALLCNQSLSLLYAYMEDYYYIDYRNVQDMRMLYAMRIFGDIDIDKVISCGCDTSNILINIISKYFNDIDISLEELEDLKDIDYFENYELYYCIPMVIYCLEQKIQNSLIKH